MAEEKRTTSKSVAAGKMPGRGHHSVEEAKT
jgi:hypothetical protein